MARRRGVTRFKRERAREFRRHPTAAEVRAWELLRDRRMLGLKFRRQQPMHGYIVDFVCVEHRLILEIDGGIHLNPEQRRRDALRSRHLRAEGFGVLRVGNNQVSARYLERLLSPFLCPLCRMFGIDLSLPRRRSCVG